MSQKMLIDASHNEETRVVVVESKKVEDFDFESLKRMQLSGNIYLAKVTRVEPSLQAAFLDYGGNRHGFLAFSEIHPDYYQIPIEERENAETDKKQTKQKSRTISRKKTNVTKSATVSTDKNSLVSSEQIISSSEVTVDIESEETNELSQNFSSESQDTKNDEFDIEETAFKKQHRKFRIQEVIKVRQILLIQIVKEERGNKGAALTTYLSLAGRYCVLMPNTPRGGGISRKITNLTDRKKLKEIANSLLVPEGSGLIIRTAGSNRTKLEIKRDYEYLIRQWEQVRDLTLSSIAPTTIYEEGSLIKRAIRDLYSRNIDEVLVEGERGYKEAKEYMKMLMPSHAKNIKRYEESVPLFTKYQVEDHLAAMFNPIAQLKSGGYIVINVTEALVAVDVNSGRATKETSIEDTALKTNLEAADELARQIKLRDLAGLIVIDFIDMEDRKNNIAVERRMKDRLKNDRARTQIGRISIFGLLEMSRQRLRPGMIETSTQACSHCHGTGITRSDDSLSLAILRELEEEGLKNIYSSLSIKTPVAIANYMLNEKRERIATIENRYNLSIKIEALTDLISPEYKIERIRGGIVDPDSNNTNTTDKPQLAKNETEKTQEEKEGSLPKTNSENNLEESQSKRRRRRRRKPKQRAEISPVENVADSNSDSMSNDQTSKDEAQKPIETIALEEYDEKNTVLELKQERPKRPAKQNSSQNRTKKIPAKTEAQESNKTPSDIRNELKATDAEEIKPKKKIIRKKQPAEKSTKKKLLPKSLKKQDQVEGKGNRSKLSSDTEPDDRTVKRTGWWSVSKASD